MLMPRTWAFNPSNLPSSASYDGIWFVQTGVQARGKNASTTDDFPRKALKVTAFPKWLGSVKSGAFCQMFSFMITLLCWMFGSFFIIIRLLYRKKWKVTSYIKYLQFVGRGKV
jgi:hypothetical protein